MEPVVYLLVLWAIMIPFRLFCTRFGHSRRVLFVVCLVVMGVTRHFDVPERWMEAVERPERAKARAGTPQRVLERSGAPKGRGRLPRPASQLEEERKRGAAAAKRARERYEAEQRRLEQQR